MNEFANGSPAAIALLLDLNSSQPVQMVPLQSAAGSTGRDTVVGTTALMVVFGDPSP